LPCHSFPSLTTAIRDVERHAWPTSLLFGDGPKLTRKPSAKRALLTAKFLCIWFGNNRVSNGVVDSLHGGWGWPPLMARQGHRCPHWSGDSLRGQRRLFGDGPKLTGKPSAKRALLTAKFLCIWFSNNRVAAASRCYTARKMSVMMSVRTYSCPRMFALI
jgi:hypothetical protein